MFYLMLGGFEAVDSDGERGACVHDRAELVRGFFVSELICVCLCIH